MTTGITSGKRKGLEAVADSRGVIAALEIDQRGAMPRLFAKAMGSNQRLQYALELAAEAGLIFPACFADGPRGKTAWRCFVAHGLTALEDWLHSEGVRNIENVNQHLRTAQPWFCIKEETHSE
jgi:tagatose-1,6-bisphosphate aldolase